MDELQRAASGVRQLTEALQSRLTLLREVLGRTRSAPTTLDDQWLALQEELHDIIEALQGNQSRAATGIATPANIMSRLGRVLVGTGNSTYGPTDTHKDTLGYAQADFGEVKARLSTMENESLPALEAAMQAAGAPWTPGAALPGS